MTRTRGSFRGSNYGSWLGYISFIMISNCYTDRYGTWWVAKIYKKKKMSGTSDLKTIEKKKNRNKIKPRPRQWFSTGVT